jgi:hypothetical protein
MKTQRTNRRRRKQGILIIQMIVYMAAASLIVTLSVVAFWNAFTAVRNNIETGERASLLLRAGELWRDDVRASAGRIQVESTEQGTRCRIADEKQAIVWTWNGDHFSRSVEGASKTNIWAHGLADARFIREERGAVVVWRLDAALKKVRKSERHAVAFTFRSVPARKEAP